MIRTGAMGVERKGSLLRMLLKRMKQQDLKKKISKEKQEFFGAVSKSVAFKLPLKGLVPFLVS